MEIKCWTPLYASKPINIDEFGKNPGDHPLVIFKTENGYFYLACTSNIKNQKSFHVYIPASKPINPNNNQYLFKKDSLIDTRKIFYMNKTDFEKCFQLDINKNPAYYNSPEIEDKYKKECLEKVAYNLGNNNFSFIECSLDKNNQNYVLSKCLMIGKKSKTLLMGSCIYLEGKKNISEKEKQVNINKWDEFFNQIILQKGNNTNRFQKSLNTTYQKIFIAVNNEYQKILGKNHSSQNNLGYSP